MDAQIVRRDEIRRCVKRFVNFGSDFVRLPVGCNFFFMHNIAVKYLVQVPTFADLIFPLNFKIFVCSFSFDFSIFFFIFQQEYGLYPSNFKQLRSTKYSLKFQIPVKIKLNF